MQCVGVWVGGGACVCVCVCVGWGGGDSKVKIHCIKKSSCTLGTDKGPETMRAAVGALGRGSAPVKWMCVRHAEASQEASPTGCPMHGENKQYILARAPCRGMHSIVAMFCESLARTCWPAALARECRL